MAPASESTATTAIAGANPSRNASADAKLPAPAKTAAATATPKTPPSSRIMLLAPAALPTSSREKEPTTEFCAAGIAIETPTPATTDGITNSVYDEVAEQIARYAARLIEDRSTLQVGLGRVPNEMLAHLTNRRELAIHSDVITEPIVDLVTAGVITGPVATSWAMGSRRLYDLVDGDPRFAFTRSSTSAIRRSSQAGSGWCR
jgi:hypothetical protein